MFKKFLPLIVILALLAGYAGYRAVEAQATTLATSAVTSLDSAPAAYIAWAQAVENGPMDPATNLPTTADAALWTRYLFARYGEGCCGLTR